MNLQLKQMENFKTRIFTTEIVEKDINTEERSIVHYVSTKSVDRTDEVIDPYKIVDINYRKNPVVLFNHNYDKPIGKSLWSKVDANGYGYISKTQFGKTSLAEEIFSLYKDGILNAWSIGFMPLEEAMFVNDVYVYGSIELLEYSGVAVPANPTAINLGFVKSLQSDELKSIYLNDYILNSFDTELKSLKEELEKYKTEKANQEEITNLIKENTKSVDLQITDILGELQGVKSFSKKLLEGIPSIVAGEIRKQLGRVD